MKKKLLLGLFCIFCYPRIGLTQDFQRFEYTHQQMGTTWKLLFYHNHPSEALVIRDSIFFQLDSLNQIFSDYLLSSDLNQINKQAGTRNWYQMKEELCHLIHKSLVLSEESNGTLDISMGPLSRIWRRAFRRQEFPAQKNLKNAHKKVNYRWIRFRRRTCALKLRKKGMRLDLGAVAKGETLDLLAKSLKAFGIQQYLIDGGGDIITGEAPPKAKAWRLIDLAKQEYEIKNSAMATSGSSYQYLEKEGRRYSHIIDPRSGYGVAGYRLISVKAPTGFEADAWATILSIIKEEELPGWREKLLEKNIHFNIYNSHQE